MVPSVMSARTLTPKVKVEVEEDDGTEPESDAEGIGDAVEGRRAAQLSATMQQPHDKLMLERSECWYLYHRMAPVDSAQYVSQAPVPNGPDDPNWELYTTHLLKFIDNELSKGIFNRSSEFLMTIASLNPPLADQLISAIIAEAGIFDRDDFAAALVQGGALDLRSFLCIPHFQTSLRKFVNSLQPSS